ncbi:HAUS augmin-like complex subunit 1 [Entomortierella parvispora]|uniref:HAUS augmin-like complex subunit 1 n=1 Tax=Entomortierella parvispora TaxID=205924 RepID=A0A9P3LSV1_9FUNG|nr:HAUS augmin-like complex subunit 1 [Entomortierella parvispora]
MDWSQIDRWLQNKYGSEVIPSFERTEESGRVLSELMKLNEAQDSQAKKAITALRQLSSSYRREDTRLKEVLMLFDLHRENLPAETLRQLADLADLAMILGLDDTRLESFQAGLSQLHLDLIYHTRAQRLQEARLESIERSQEKAQRDVEDLRELQHRWMEERESTGDMELRTRRRSTELSKIHSAEDEVQLQNLEKRQREEGLDVNAQGLSVSQLEASERRVHEYQEQVEAQNKMLSAYQQLPPDYSLATLKVREATMKLDELSAEHESLVGRMADSL